MAWPNTFANLTAATGAMLDANFNAAAPLGGSATQAFDVKAATGDTQAVALSQVKNATPVYGANTVTGISASVSAGPFTAPSNGILLLFGDAVISGGVLLSTLSLTATLAGIVVAGQQAIAPACFVRGFLPMTTGQTATATFTADPATSATVGIVLLGVFVPTP